MPAEFSEAPSSVIRTAEEIISKYRPFLRDVRIAFVLRIDEQPLDADKAKTIKVPAALQTVADYDFLIWIDQQFWEAQTEKKRKALILHQLCHIGPGANDGFTIVDHDFADFNLVVEEFGLWSTNLFHALNNLQPKLPFADAEPDKTKSKVVAADVKGLTQLVKE